MNHETDQTELGASLHEVMRKKKNTQIFVFDTSVLIDYLHDEEIAVNAFAKASQIGEIRLTIISLLELHLPQRSDAAIQADLEKVKGLQKAYRLRVVSIPRAAQWFGLNEIARYHRSTLGRSLLSDSLILGCGAKNNVFLVTRDKKWLKLIKDRRRPLDLRVIRPEELVQDA